MFSALLVGLSLSGCILGSERPDLSIETPQRYRNAGPRAPDAAVPSPEWWRGFRSKELTTLIEDAQIANLDIAAAYAQIVQADAQVGIAGAPLLPTLSGLADAQKSRQPSVGGSSPTIARRYTVGLSASYMVDFWGKNRAAYLAAEENAFVARYNHEVVTLSAIAAVANTYFQIAAAREQLQVARSNLAAAERVLALVRKQFAAGTASQLDVSQQETLVANQRATIPPLEINLRQGSATLAVLLARAPAHFNVAGGSTRQISVPRVTPGLPSQLLYQRPDIRLAEARLQASNYNVESARAALFPQVQLTAATGWQSAALASLFVPGAWYYTLAAGLTQPIFDGYLLRSQLEQARGVQLQNLEEYRKAVLSAFADVEKALVALEQYTEQERLQAAAVASSRRAFNVAETQLRGGTVNLITVLQTQLTLFAAENAAVQVRLSRLLAASSLFQALGGAWTPSAAAGTGPPPRAN